MTFGRRVLHITLWGLGGLLVLGLAGILWLRQSPYWAGFTLFAEPHRVENFRAMDRIFPSRPVPRNGSVRAFDADPRPLPATYRYDGAERDLAAFLDRTVTTGIVVVHRGAITHEAYHLGADGTSPFTSWSVAKSVVSALIGIAVEEGRIASIRDPISAYVPALADSAYGDVPIEDALTMSSGVAFDEGYDNPFSDINMVFIRAMALREPVEQTLARLKRARLPGTFNDYVSADTMALGLVLESVTGMPLADYLAARLWGPMGAEASASWSTDLLGREFALCCVNATLRDWARFGRLYLEGGAREDRQIVPAAWVAASVNLGAPHLQPGENPASSWMFGYGYKWWIPEDPQGDFLAIGVWGQYVYIDPVRERPSDLEATQQPRQSERRHARTQKCPRRAPGNLFDGVARRLRPRRQRRDGAAGDRLARRRRPGGPEMPPGGPLLMLVLMPEGVFRRGFQLALWGCVLVVAWLAFAPFTEPAGFSWDKANHVLAFCVVLYIGLRAWVGWRLQRPRVPSRSRP